MGLEEKLQLINDTKQQIRNKIIEKGVHVAESVPFRDYPDYIQQIEPQPAVEMNEWIADPEWWDIEGIIKNDVLTGEYERFNDYNKIIFLFDDEATQTGFYVNTDGGSYKQGAHAVKTSDGAFYPPQPSNSNHYYHTWDTSKDKPCTGQGKKTRYAILYYKPETYTQIGEEWKNSEHTSLMENCLYIVTQVPLCNSNSSANTPKLQAVKYIKDAYIVKSTSYPHFWTFNAPLLQSICVEKTDNPCETLNFCKNYCDIKIPAHTCLHKDTSTGLWTINPQTVNSSSSSNTYCYTNRLDISEIDFTDHMSEIFYPYFIINELIGVINLSGNTKVPEFNIFTENTSCPMKFNLILPPNASVNLRCGKSDKQSLKFLVENAPTIEESHTLTMSSSMYAQLRNMPYNYPIVYNNQNFCDGIQVLTLKGWTVTTI